MPRRVLDAPRIVIDTREQLPFAFKGLPTVRATLKTGDYSIEGYTDRVAVERKSKEDAYGCVGASRERFKRCMSRLADYERAAVVIECSVGAFIQPPARSAITGTQAVGSFTSWMATFRVPVIWCDSRELAEQMTVRFLLAYVRKFGRPTAAAADPDEPAIHYP